jgi:hypothetical protein
MTMQVPDLGRDAALVRGPPWGQIRPRIRNINTALGDGARHRRGKVVAAPVGHGNRGSPTVG